MTQLKRKQNPPLNYDEGFRTKHRYLKHLFTQTYNCKHVGFLVRNNNRNWASQPFLEMWWWNICPGYCFGCTTIPFILRRSVTVSHYLKNSPPACSLKVWCSLKKCSFVFLPSYMLSFAIILTLGTVNVKLGFAHFNFRWQ